MSAAQRSHGGGHALFAVFLAIGSATLEDFESSELGKLPAGFTIGTTVGDPKYSGSIATWQTCADDHAPSGKRVVRLTETRNREEVFNLLWRDEMAPADLSLSVALHADAGKDDRGGGLVWRAQDALNFYLCRWNPLEKNLRVYCIANGRRDPLQSVTIECDGAAWHTLAVTMKGRVIEVSFDGEKKITLADPTYKEAGRVALWTKGDAASSFDDFTVTPLEPDVKKVKGT